MVAGTFSGGSGGAEGVPERQFQTITDELQVAMAAHVTPDNLPGLVYGVRRGQDQVITAIGNADIESVVPMREDAIFRMASLTKPVTGVAAMILVEDGLIAIDEPVDRLLPELANRRVLRDLTSQIDDTVPADRAITVEDLLTCRMGMGFIFAPGEYPINAALDARDLTIFPRLHPPEFASGDAWIAALSELPLMHQPGTSWMYDTSVMALGVLIERASGQTLPDFCQSRIFGPLGMNDTGFHVPAEKADRLPPCYWRNFMTGEVEASDPGGDRSWFANSPGFASAAGGLVSTAADFMTFATAMLRRGAYEGGRLISQASYAQMTANHVTSDQTAASPLGPGFWDKTGWGYCTAIFTARESTDPQGVGWMGGYGTACAWDHDSKTVGLLLTSRLFDTFDDPHLQDFWLGMGRLRAT